MGRFGEMSPVRTILRLTGHLKRGTMETSSARSPMLVLFEGRVHPGFTMRDVLKQIFLLQSPGPGVLRVTSTDGTVNGHIHIHDCTFITGASLKVSGIVGYDALRTIIANFSQGSFALLSVQKGDSFESDQSMNIEVRKLAEDIDHLPESPVGLFDQTSLLDKVFNPSAAPQTPQPAKVMATPPSELQSIFGRVLLAPEEAAKPDVNWSAVQPFLGGDPGTSGSFPVRTTGGARRESSSPDPRSTGELRALSSQAKIETQRTIRNVLTTVISIVVFVAITAGVAWFVRNYLDQATTPAPPREAKVEQLQSGSELDVSLSPPKKWQGAADAKSKSTAKQRSGRSQSKEN
jgi:hypothetical protein